MRISLEGEPPKVRRRLRLCRRLRFQELLVDDDGVYVRDDDVFYRFAE